MEQFFVLLANVAYLYTFVLLARAIISWIPNMSRANPIVDLLYQVTEPVLEPVRRLVPPMGGFDISFLVVFFGLQMLARVLLDIGRTF